jgi:hypothetical protein
MLNGYSREKALHLPAREITARKPRPSKIPPPGSGKDVGLSSPLDRSPEPEPVGSEFIRITALSFDVSRSALLNTTASVDIIVIAGTVPLMVPPASGSGRSRYAGPRLLPEVDKLTIAMMQASKPHSLRDIAETLIVLRLVIQW